MQDEKAALSSTIATYLSKPSGRDNTYSEIPNAKPKIDTVWAQFVNAVLGIWLMAAPAVLGYGSPAQTNDRIIGPVVATFAVVAWWEATRPVRRFNIPLGLWMLIAPWVLGYSEASVIVNSLAAGVLITGLSFVRGRVEGRYGGGWSALWRSAPSPDQAAHDSKSETA